MLPIFYKNKLQISIGFLFFVKNFTIFDKTCCFYYSIMWKIDKETSIKKGAPVMFWDTHMHCYFSGDCDAAPEDMIRQAIRIGLTGICFTDHLDLDNPVDPDFTFDFTARKKALDPLVFQHQNTLSICQGIEIGLQPHLADRHRQLVSDFPFDFVIGSSHLANGLDPYYPAYFEGKTESDAYLEYFESILNNIQVYDDFDVYGHIDYVVRYGPNQNRNYSYRKYGDVLDAILHSLIDMGKGIELNTGGFKAGLGQPNPSIEIIKRYHELGGEIITMGADAHSPEYVGFEFEKAVAILKDAGFKYYTVFQNRTPEFITLQGV